MGSSRPRSCDARPQGRSRSNRRRAQGDSDAPRRNRRRSGGPLEGGAEEKRAADHGRSGGSMPPASGDDRGRHGGGRHGEDRRHGSRHHGDDKKDGSRPREEKRSLERAPLDRPNRDRDGGDRRQDDGNRPDRDRDRGVASGGGDGHPSTGRRRRKRQADDERAPRGDDTRQGFVRGDDRRQDDGGGRGDQMTSAAEEPQQRNRDHRGELDEQRSAMPNDEEQAPWHSKSDQSSGGALPPWRVGADPATPKNHQKTGRFQKQQHQQRPWDNKGSGKGSKGGRVEASGSGHTRSAPQSRAPWDDKVEGVGAERMFETWKKDNKLCIKVAERDDEKGTMGRLFRDNRIRVNQIRDTSRAKVDYHIDTGVVEISGQPRPVEQAEAMIKEMILEEDDKNAKRRRSVDGNEMPPKPPSPPQRGNDREIVVARPEVLGKHLHSSSLKARADVKRTRSPRTHRMNSLEPGEVGFRVFPVPRKHKSRIIDPDQMDIIKATSGASVEYRGDAGDTLFKVKISGEKEQIEIAHELMQQLVSASEINAFDEITVNVLRSVLPSLYLSAIENETKAKIKENNNPEEDEYEALVISGHPSEVAKAKSIVVERAVDAVDDEPKLEHSEEAEDVWGTEDTSGLGERSLLALDYDQDTRLEATVRSLTRSRSPRSCSFRSRGAPRPKARPKGSPRQSSSRFQQSGRNGDDASAHSEASASYSYTDDEPDAQDTVARGNATSSKTPPPKDRRLENMKILLEQVAPVVPASPMDAPPGDLAPGGFESPMDAPPGNWAADPEPAARGADRLAPVKLFPLPPGAPDQASNPPSPFFEMAPANPAPPSPQSVPTLSPSPSPSREAKRTVPPPPNPEGTPRIVPPRDFSQELNAKPALSVEGTPDKANVLNTLAAAVRAVRAQGSPGAPSASGNIGDATTSEAISVWAPPSAEPAGLTGKATAPPPPPSGTPGPPPAPPSVPAHLDVKVPVPPPPLQSFAPYPPPPHHVPPADFVPNPAPPAATSTHSSWDSASSGRDWQSHHTKDAANSGTDWHSHRTEERPRDYNKEKANDDHRTWKTDTWKSSDRGGDKKWNDQSQASTQAKPADWGNQKWNEQSQASTQAKPADWSSSQKWNDQSQASTQAKPADWSSSQKWSDQSQASTQTKSADWGSQKWNDQSQASTQAKAADWSSSQKWNDQSQASAQETPADLGTQSPPPPPAQSQPEDPAMQKSSYFVPKASAAANPAQVQNSFFSEPRKTGVTVHPPQWGTKVVTNDKA